MKKCTPDQIVGKLRQADVELSKGKTVKEVCRVIEITEQTYYRWRQKYGGMSPELIKELKGLQKENQRLRKIIADQRIDMEILKEAMAFDSKNC
jgi:putative transposase